jgi:hypothetical protein
MAAAYVATIVITALQNVVLTSTQNSDYRRNVRFWHKADNPTTVRAFVRYWSNSGHSNELRYGKQKR